MFFLQKEDRTEFQLEFSITTITQLIIISIPTMNCNAK